MPAAVLAHPACPDGCFVTLKWLCFTLFKSNLMMMMMMLMMMYAWPVANGHTCVA